ncbi:MAG: FAD-binding protein, partial [Rhabdaerophilum sp.]
MITLRRPRNEDELAGIVREVEGLGASLNVQGGGTRAGLGRPGNNAVTISTADLSGVTLHEPAEMVISARAGTPLR